MDIFRATSATVACTLTPADLGDVGSAWQKLFRLSLVSREDVPGGLRLVMHPDSAPALRELIDIERDSYRAVHPP